MIAITAVVASTISAIVVSTVQYQSHIHRLRSATWEELITKLQAVPRKGLETVALDTLQPKVNQLQLEPPDMWQLLGGIKGLQRMKENAQILIALAAYVQRWNYTEATIVAERMRMDAVHLKRAVFHIQVEMLLHSKWMRMPFYVHEAAASYYLMTQRLFALYESSHAGLLPRLKEAI
jgi:hypothetical protein